jgi:hypothetical protein
MRMMKWMMVLVLMALACVCGVRAAELAASTVTVTADTNGVLKWPRATNLWTSNGISAYSVGVLSNATASTWRTALGVPATNEAVVVSGNTIVSPVAGNLFTNNGWSPWTYQIMSNTTAAGMRSALAVPATNETVVLSSGVLASPGATAFFTSNGFSAFSFQAMSNTSAADWRTALVALGSDEGRAAIVARESRNGLYFNGAGSMTLNSVAWPGTNDYTVEVVFRRDISVGGYMPLVGSMSIGSAGWALYMNGSYPVVEMWNGASSFSTWFPAAGAKLGSGTHRISMSVGRSDGSIKMWVDGQLTETKTHTFPGGVSITSTTAWGLGYAWIGYLRGSIHGVRLWNRTMTDSEVLESHSGGLDGADMYGDVGTSVHESDFSAGAQTWVDNYSGQVSVTGNIDGVEGQGDDWLRITRTNSGLGKASIVSSVPTGMVGPGWYLCRADIYNPSGSTITHFNLSIAGGVPTPVSRAIPAGTRATVEWVLPAYTGSSLRIHPCTDVAADVNVDSGQVWYVKGIRIMRLGCVADYGACGIQPAPGQWLDCGPHKVHGAMSASGVWPMRGVRSGELRVMTSGSGNAWVLGDRACVPTNAVINRILATSSGSSTVSVGEAAAGTTIVNAQALSTGHNYVALAGRLTTNQKLSIASGGGTIYWTIYYDVVE